MLPIISIGPLSLQTPGLILLLGVWLGLSLAERHAAQHRVDAEGLYTLVLLSIIFGIVGARLAYIIQHASAFVSSPFSMLSLNPGLLDIWGGLAAAIIAALIYGQRKGMSFFPLMDALTPGFATFAIALALSNLASGSGFGSPTNLPWSIELWGAQRHPTQLYEGIGAAIILWRVWSQFGHEPPQPAGRTFLRFISLSAGLKIFLEAFRGDSVLVLGNLRAAQIVAWIILALSLWTLGKLQHMEATTSKPEVINF